MRETVELRALQTPPDHGRLAGILGLPAPPAGADRLRELMDAARDLYAELARPRGLFEEVTRAEFEAIYHGEGMNDRPAPMEEIIPRADHLAVFAATLGEALCAKIRELFGGNEPAIGFILDAMAGERADDAARGMGQFYLDRLGSEGRTDRSARILPYSPGYCGWHLTGQRKLFDRLRPGEVGIALLSSGLMEPLKSVSGVLIAGPGEIHRFDDHFEFCDDCATHACRDRIATVLDGAVRP
jgi:hypothetical protein